MANSKRQLKVRSAAWRGTPGSKWEVRVRVGAGKYKRHFFPTKDEAKAWADAFAIREANEGTKAALGVSDTDRVLAMRAAELLRPYGANILDAARHYAEHLERLSATETVEQAVEALLEAKEIDGASERYLQDLRSRLRRFAAAFGERGVSVVTTADIDDWLRGLKLGAQTRTNFRRVLFTLWQSCIARGTARENPVALTTKPKVKRGDTAILKPAQLRRLLSKLKVHAVPGVAIAAFAGLRSAEIGRLTWGDVDLESGYITVSAAKAKTASRRLVPISDNLCGWIAPYATAKGAIVPTGFWKLVKAAADEAKIKPWPQNCLRHSYASYRLAVLKDAAAVAHELGNSAEVVHRHYAELVTPAQAVDWFGITPDTGSKVIPLVTG